MQFYTIEQLDDRNEIKSDGMNMTQMSKVFKLIDKHSSLKTFDDLADFDIIFLENHYSFTSNNKLQFSHSDKKITFALFNAEDIIEVFNGGTSAVHYITKHGDDLISSINKTKLLERKAIQLFKTANEVEAKAVHWLENGQVGMSSATICATLYPNLKEHFRLKRQHDCDGNFENRYPLDNSDFKRCVGFWEAVPEAKERMEELKVLGTPWKNLVDNWSKIETLDKDGKHNEAYSLIKECINQKKKNTP